MVEILIKKNGLIKKTTKTFIPQNRTLKNKIEKKTVKKEPSVTIKVLKIQNEIKRFISKYQNYPNVIQVLICFSNLYGTTELIKTFDLLKVRIHIYEFEGTRSIHFFIRDKTVKADIVAHTAFMDFLITQFRKKKIQFRPMFLSDEEREAAEEREKRRLKMQEYRKNILKILIKNLKINKPIMQAEE